MKKYRPYFTLPELEAILESTKMNSKVVIQGKDLIIYLERFIRDIKDGLKDASLTLNPKPTLEQRLGFVPASKGASKLELTAGDTNFDILSIHAEYNRTGYTNLTPAQIEILNQYLFENDLMTPEQEANYTAMLMSANSWLSKKG